MNSNLIPTAVINPGAPVDCLEAKQPDIDNGTAVHDKSGYFSQEYMAREWDDIWTRSWLLAGVVSDLPNLGDYFLFRVRHESFIISNSPEGIVAFYNVCPHRGSRLLSEERGNQKVFVCPFHSWSFTHGGALRSITDEETFKPEVVSHRPSLKRARCEVHAGLIFINMDEDAAPVSGELGLPEGYLENYQIDSMKVVRHVRSEWCSNWKVGVEAFYESYHLHAVHPETRGVMSDLNVQYDLYPKGASRMIVPLGQPSPRFPDQVTVNEGLQFMLREAGVDPEAFTGTALDVRAAIQQGKRERSQRLGLGYERFTDGQLSDSWATGIFPNVQIGCHPEAIFLMRFLPHDTDPQKFWYDTMTLMFPVDDPDYCPPAWMGLPENTDVTGRKRAPTESYLKDEDPGLGLVLGQDAAFLPSVQEGMSSKAFQGQLWGEQEQRLRHFHVELEKRLGIKQR